MDTMLDEPSARRQKLVVESPIHTEFNDLPDDLVIEILCRLPHHKFVFQCKCISKHWLSLISNPKFVHRYITHWLPSKPPIEQPWAFMYFTYLDVTLRPLIRIEEQTPKLISQFSDFKYPGFCLKFLPCYKRGESITVIKTSNDLILCCVEKFDHSECIYYICNPQTEQWMALPPTPPLLSCQRCSAVEFICEPYYDQLHQGKVILNSQFKFKVLRFLSNIRNCLHIMTLQIFSSETGKWNLTEISIPLEFRTADFKIMRSFFYKEKLTLIVIIKSRLSFMTIDDNLEHCLQRVEFPGSIHFMRPSRSTIQVSSRQGNLCIVQMSINGMARDHFLRIWEFKDNKWKLEHEVSFRDMVYGDQWITKYYLMPVVLGFHPYNDNLLYLNCDNRIASYNIKENTLSCVTKTWWRWRSNNFPLFSLATNFGWFSDVSQLKLPLWPTPLPQIDQSAFLPPRIDESDQQVSKKELSLEEANELFMVIFGREASKDILAQWSNKGIRFSSDPETSIGLVQHEGGPSGVLAAIQAFVFKYIIVCSPKAWKDATTMQQDEPIPTNKLSSIPEHEKERALVESMCDILFTICGNARRAVIASLAVKAEGISEDETKTIAKALEGLSIQSALDLQKILTVETYTSPASAQKRLKAMIPVFQSHMGVMLFLISALLSVGLGKVQTDRDDPNKPLASQEIVNLLLCRLDRVFLNDERRKDLDEGIPRDPLVCLVGFLTVESQSLVSCKVDQHLKFPIWPTWVVGAGESQHYTVLFALDTSIVNDTELKERESEIRKVFDEKGQSGDGGFISVEGFHQFLPKANIELEPAKVEHLCSRGLVLWSEFWQVILDLDKSLGGLKGLCSSGFMGKRDFDLYHFDGASQAIISGGKTESSPLPLPRSPRLRRLRVSIPPIDDVAVSSISGANDSWVQRIRTRWPRAICSWSEDPPSIVYV